MIPATTEFRRITSREEWLSWRLKVLTGGDVAAIAGVNRYRTPLSVYVEKAGVNVFPSGENNLMTRGRWFEHAIMAGLRERYPTWQIVKANVFMIDAARRLGGTPDFVAIDPERPGYGIIDGKVVMRRVFAKTWLRLDGDEIDEVDEGGHGAAVPLNHQLQVIHYAKLSGATWAAVAPMVMSEFRADLLCCDVPIHEGAWQRILREADYFWREFDAGRRPTYDRERDGPVLRALYPHEIDNGEDPPYDLTGNNRIVTLLEERAALKAAVKEAETEISNIETDVIAIVGDHAVSRAPGRWRIGFKVESRAAYMMPARSNRVLRITKSKGRS